MQHHYDTAKGICFNWIYSFMISKHLFLKFLGTPSLSEGPGTILMSNIVIWFKNHVENHENKFCYYLRMHLLHFGEYSNSATEGIHKGMKYHSAPVLPYHKLHRTLDVLTKNVIRKEETKQLQSSMNYLFSRTYEYGNQFQHIIEYALVSLKQSLEYSSKYTPVKQHLLSFW